MVEKEVDSGEDDFNMEDFSGSPGKDPRWKSLNNLILRPTTGGLTMTDFEPCTELLNFMRNDLKILVVGAGGLGCELLKNLALLGFNKLSVIDMDTIDLSNLNRQFLFRQSDIGKSKAECAANFIMSRIPGCEVTAYFKKIEDFDEEFYRQFKIIVCGLDSVVARRWMNRMLYDEDENVIPNSVVYLVDGGTEGFKGNVRVVTPGMTACLECSIGLYPPAVNYPMCTIAHMPRLPEHCIEYAKIFLWPKEWPFGAEVAVDGDDPKHVEWIYMKSEERAKEFKILGVTYRLTLGVIKHIIPAVASTNAVIASASATEVFKLASGLYKPLDNFFIFNDTEGIYSSSFQIEKNEQCLACSQKPQKMTVKSTDTIRSFIDFLKNSGTYQMRSPGLTAVIEGKSRTLYFAYPPSLEEATRANLGQSFASLGMKDEQEIVVADPTSPASMTFIVRFVD